MTSRLMAVVLVLASWSLGAPTRAYAQGPSGFVQGFGGFTFGSASLDGSFAGRAGASLTDNVQAFGEVGYMRDTLSSGLLGGIIDLASDLTGVNVRRSGFYGDGGMRLLTSSRSPVRGYVEGSVGAMHLSYNVDLPNDEYGIGNIVNGLLNRVSSTEPVVGFGGGVIIQPGRVFLDLGYRYKRILTDDPIGLNEAGVAIGVTF